MRLFHRRDAPPADIVSRLPPDEPVVSWADTAEGTVVLATRIGLWWPTAQAHRLIGWQYVNKATWHDGRLAVTEAQVEDDLVLVDLPPVVAELTVVRDLPPTVRKRVEGNVVRSEVQPVAGGTARFVVRRKPGAGGLVWWARFEDGTPDTAVAREEIAARIAWWRAEWAAAQADL